MDITEAMSIIPRSLGSLLTLFFVTKLMGKKQVSELSLFDYVIGISIGNFTAEVTMGLDKQYIDGLIAIIAFGIVSWGVSKITMKSITLRRLIIGTPTVVIQKGKILEKSLKKLNIDINDLLEQCRSNGNFDISQIEYGIMEVNGKVSILLKSQYNPVTPKDLNIKTEQQELIANVVIDGKVMHNNLLNMKKDDKWLYKELKVKGYELDDVLLATLDSNEKLNIYEKNMNEEAINILE